MANHDLIETNADSADSPAPGLEGTYRWLTPGRFAVLLASLIFLTCSGVILGTGTFFFRDFGIFGYPLAFYHREAFWNGQMPLWNPLNNCGLPFLAQWNTLTLYPLSLFYLLFPLSWSLGVFCLLHQFLGGMGMYFLAYRWTGNRLAAAVAGVVFSFNGLTAGALMWPNNSAALGWMPWVILASERAWRDGGRRAIALAALAGAMQMLAGAPEIILQTWCIAGCLWLGQIFTSQSGRGLVAARFFMVLGLVTALAAAQLLPFLDLLAHSQRDAGFGDARWAMPLDGLANYLAPLFHKIRGDKGSYSQYEQYWISSYYVGVATVVLTIMAALKIRKMGSPARTGILLFLALLSIGIALGENGGVYNCIKRVVPQIGFLRFPIKFIVMATFAFPVLAAFGLARVSSGTPETSERRQLVSISVVVIGVLAVTALIAWRTPHAAADDTVAFDVPGTLWNTLVRAVLFTVILGVLARLRTAASPRIKGGLAVGLVALFWVDLATHSPSLHPIVERSVFQADMIRDYLRWGDKLAVGESRAMPTPAAILQVRFHVVPKAADTIIGSRVTLSDNANLLDHAAKVNGFYSLYLRENEAMNRYLYTVTNGLERLKDFMGVSEISNPTNYMEWSPRGSQMPIITAGQKAVFADDSAAYRKIMGDDFTPRAEVLLPPEAAGIVSATNGCQAKLLSKHFTAEKVSMEVEAAAPAMVVVAQSFYHPWQAYVDGRPARLWRANFAFQAVETPAGRHQVALVYEDAAFHCGVGISLIAVGGCLLLLLSRPRNRRPAPARAAQCGAGRAGAGS